MCLYRQADGNCSQVGFICSLALWWFLSDARLYTVVAFTKQGCLLFLGLLNTTEVDGVVLCLPRLYIYIVVHTDFGVQTCVIKHVKVKK